MTLPLDRSLSPRAWAIVVWFTAIFVNVRVSGLVVAWEQQFLAKRGVTAEAFKDLSRSPLALEPKWLILNAAAVQLTLLACAGLWLWRFGLRESLPLRRVSPKQWAGTFLLSLGALPIGGALEELVRRALGQSITNGLFIAKVAHQSSPSELFGLLLCIAVLPGIAEEILFRGVITNKLQTYSKLEALILPSVLFGMAHIEPAQAAGTAILGLAFGFARLSTGSIFPCMAAHILNNALVLTLAFFGDQAPTEDGTIEWPILVVGALFVASGVGLLRQNTPDSVVS
ncbi:MAG: type II CAAX endopeptidase family protein [Polyangiaceae bacterium]|nr:type II CAAX endopeptidase family protein [Polyangiaceae bacterium]